MFVSFTQQVFDIDKVTLLGQHAFVQHSACQPIYQAILHRNDVDLEKQRFH